MRAVLRTIGAVALVVSFCAPAAASAHRRYGQIRLAFEPNRGQTNADVRYLVRGGNFAALFEDRGAVLKLAGARESVLRLTWTGSGRPQIHAGEPTGGVSHYLRGASPRRWQTGVPHFAQLRYQGLYSGIDAIYYSRAGELEYDLIVAPGADPAQIGFRIGGALSVRVSRGDLVIETGAGELRQRRPVAWQVTAGRRKAVTSSYHIGTDGIVRFALGRYDRSRELVIDPVISYGLYVGGSGLERADAIAVDRQGSAYIAGQTVSADYPASNGGQMQPGGAGDAFVFKLDSAGQHIVYSTYLGGSGSDAAHGIAVDSTGSAYVTGETSSANFPAFAPLRVTPGGGVDAFLAKLTPAGNALVFSTYLGGSQNDIANAISLDSNGNVYVGGSTSSPNLTNAANTLSGPSDGFAAKINADGQSIAYSVYIGGSGADNVYGIAATASFFYVAGDTSSSDLPGAAFQPARSGGNEAMAGKYSAADGGRLYLGYLGGSGSEVARSVAVDRDGNAVVAGYTTSSNFPLAAPVQATYGGGVSDAFVSKIHSSGNSLQFSTFIGGGGEDRAYGVAVDAQGAAIIAGETFSPDFPLRGSLRQAGPGGLPDGFVTKLHPLGTSLLYSTRFGGAGDDRVSGVAADADSSVYITGTTTSGDLPVTIHTGLRLQDAFLFKLNSQCTYDFSPASLTFGPAGGTQMLSILSGSECAWDVRTSAGFLTVGSPSAGGASGSVTITASANPGETRYGLIEVGTIPVQVTQSGGQSCQVAISPASASVPATGGSGSVAVSAAGGCYWPATTGAAWVSVSPSGGSGSGSVGYSVAANTSATSRSATIDIGGTAFLISQPGSNPGRAASAGVYGADGVWRLDSDKSFSLTPADLAFAWGGGDAKPATGDWNGDGRLSVAAYIGGTWYIDADGSGSYTEGDLIFRWGNPNSTPLPGDWNGDGITDVGVWEAGMFLLDLNGNRRLDPGEAFNWGPADAIPVTGDWNGNGKTKIGCYKDGYWTLDLNGDTVYTVPADRHFHFGQPGEMPVVGDWSGSGTSKVGISKDGKWIVDVNGTFAFDAGDYWFAWGSAGAKPVVGDWSGTGVTKVGVYEDKNGTGAFTLDFNGNRIFEPGTDKYFGFGSPADVPFAGRW